MVTSRSVFVSFWFRFRIIFKIWSTNPCSASYSQKKEYDSWGHSFDVWLIELVMPECLRVSFLISAICAWASITSMVWGAFVLRTNWWFGLAQRNTYDHTVIMLFFKLLKNWFEFIFGPPALFEPVAGARIPTNPTPAWPHLTKSKF